MTLCDLLGDVNIALSLEGSTEHPQVTVSHRPPRIAPFEAQSRGPPARCLRFAVTVAHPHARLATGLLARL
jgi:hypothetical protein